MKMKNLLMAITALSAPSVFSAQLPIMLTTTMIDSAIKDTLLTTVNPQSRYTLPSLLRGEDYTKRLLGGQNLTSLMEMEKYQHETNKIDLSSFNSTITRIEFSALREAAPNGNGGPGHGNK